jgi:hypothetical protein
MIESGMERSKICEKIIELADKQKYEEPITENEKTLLSSFDCLNIKKDTRQNIENFFDLLDELIEFVKGGA